MAAVNAHAVVHHGVDNLINDGLPACRGEQYITPFTITAQSFLITNNASLEDAMKPKLAHSVPLPKTFLHF